MDIILYSTYDLILFNYIRLILINSKKNNHIIFLNVICSRKKNNKKIIAHK